MISGFERRSSRITASLGTTFPRPSPSFVYASRQYASALPMLRLTVESERSRWRRLVVRYSERNDRSEFAFERLPSLFSKSMGLTLWGIVEDPVSVFAASC